MGLKSAKTDYQRIIADAVDARVLSYETRTLATYAAKVTGVAADWADARTTWDTENSAATLTLKACAEELSAAITEADSADSALDAAEESNASDTERAEYEDLSRAAWQRVSDAQSAHAEARKAITSKSPGTLAEFTRKAKADYREQRVRYAELSKIQADIAANGVGWITGGNVVDWAARYQLQNVTK